MLISCSFNSFSVFGHYISAWLQIIWRPYLWLVWSFTQMVSFLEFSISNPVFSTTATIHLFLPKHLLNANVTCSISITTNNRFIRQRRCSILAQIHFLLFTHHILFHFLFHLACPHTIPWHPHCCVPTPPWTSVSSLFPIPICLNKIQECSSFGLGMW